MINTIIKNYDNPKRNYLLKYPQEIPMISKNQKERLTAYIYQNILDEQEIALRVSELEDLSSADAEYGLYLFSMGHW